MKVFSILFKVPTKSCSKAAISDYLVDNGVSVVPEWTKERLLRELTSFVAACGGREALTVYAVDEIAKASGAELLRLPPYHCQLNPIEHTWAWIKGRLSDYAHPNTTKLEALCRKAEELAYSIPEHIKKNLFESAVHVEDRFIESDGISRTISMEVEKMIIDLNEDEEDDDDFFCSPYCDGGDLNLDEELNDEEEDAIIEREGEEREERQRLHAICKSNPLDPNNYRK